jgi:hypothetical protein
MPPANHSAEDANVINWHTLHNMRLRSYGVRGEGRLWIIRLRGSPSDPKGPSAAKSLQYISIRDSVVCTVFSM